MQEMKIGPSTATEHLLRPQTGQRMKLKEKFVAIYDMFLRGQDPIQGKDSEMFWDELFLIKVNTKHLSSSLRQIGEDQLLAIKDEINSIFLHAVNAVTDPLPQRRLHAMQTLTILLSEIFRKKFNNWSFDVIHLLTGLSQADYVFGVLLQGLDSLLGNEAPLELRTAALRLAITIASGNDNVNKNSLNEYFMQKDLFTSLAKFLVSVDDDDLAFEVMTLLGLLANYNKYEIQNPYLIQLADLNDDAIFHKMSMVLAHKFDDMQRDYTEVMDDDDPSTVSRVASALSYVSGMLWNPKGQDTTSTGATFAFLPNGKATVLLVFYDLIHNNKRFLRVFLNYSTPELSMATPQTMGDKTEDPKNSLDGKDTALGSFLSFVSYLSQHNRTPRTAPYTQLCLIIVQIIVEDPSSYQHLCIIPQSQDSTPTTRALRANPMASVRLCRQRQPVLPKAKQARPMAAVVLDVVLGFLKHNMKKKLQVDCFRIAVAIIFALASRFRSLRVRLPYHWAEMWNTIQGLVKFLHANATGLQYNIEARDLIAEAIDLVNYFATYGDLLMPDPGSLYALYYEIVRTGIDPFIELAKEFSIVIHPALPAPLPHHDLTSRDRLHLPNSPQTPGSSESTIGSSPLTVSSPSRVSSPPPSPFNTSHRSSPPNSSGSIGGQHQRTIILDLSNINQIFTFFYSHLLTWRDSNPTRSLGPELVTAIIKAHYQELALVPIPLDGYLVQRTPLGGTRGHRGNNNIGMVPPPAVSPPPFGGASPHPGWEGYSEVPGRVFFFRQLIRWVVSDFRALSKSELTFAPTM